MNVRKRPARSNSYDSYLTTSTWQEGYINSLFELDYKRNPSTHPEEKKVQYAFYIWTKDSKNTDKQIDDFKSDTKDSWTEVYQLIGFFSVFQGVLFQGLSQLTAQLSCSFYVIPFTLSLLTSLATLAGVHFKLSKVRGYRKAFFRAKIRSKVLDTRIRACRNSVKNGLLTIDFTKIEEDSNRAVNELTQNFEEQLGSAHRVRVVVLALLAIVSGLFAWMIRVIMCHEYY